MTFIKYKLVFFFVSQFDTISQYHFFLVFITGTTQAKTSEILKIEHWSTKNGIPVYFVAKKEIPIIDIGLLFHAGSAQDKNLPGVAQFTAEMLDQGTKNLTANQIANEFETVGAHYNVSVNRA